MVNLQRFKSLISKAKIIVITTHVGPDADGIGSQIALALALRQLGKQVYCINEEDLQSRYKYLDKKNVVRGSNDFQRKKIKKIDLFIVVDANSIDRIGDNLKELSQKSVDLLFIDHHPTSEEFIALHCIDTSSAATGEIIAKLIKEMKISFSFEMALALYTSIIINTSSFQYYTISSSTHHTVSTLLETGISPPLAMKEIYGQTDINFYHFLGKVLSKTKTSKSNKLIYVEISSKELQAYNIDPEDTHGIINQLISYKPAEIICMFREIDKAVTKVSFRSMGKINVGSIAQALGGGGHSHSAATIINLPLKKCISHVLDKVEFILNVTNL